MDASDGADASDAADGTASGGTGSDGASVECPPGTVPKYNGLCVEDETANMGSGNNVGGAGGSGCSVSDPRSGDAPLVLVMVLLASLFCRARMHSPEIRR